MLVSRERMSVANPSQVVPPDDRLVPIDDAADTVGCDLWTLFRPIRIGLPTHIRSAEAVGPTSTSQKFRTHAASGQARAEAAGAARTKSEDVPSLTDGLRAVSCTPEA